MPPLRLARPLLAFAFLPLALQALATPPAAFGEDAVPKWLWISDQPGAEETVFFRHEFELPGDVERALLLASGDNRIQIFVNGPPRPHSSDEWTSPVVEDVTDQLKPGETNLFAVRAQNAGGAAAMLLLLELTHADGSKSRIVSDETWLVAGRGERQWNEPGYEPAAVEWGEPVVLGKLGDGPWTAISEERVVSLLDFRVPEATPAEAIRVPEGFQVELLYSVPKASQGSWVTMTIDDRQRLIVSDQYGPFYRIRIPGPGETVSAGDVEEIALDIGGAQGLAYAFGSLYAVLNTGEHGGRGLYRLRDTNGDDQYDSKELLRKFEESGGEHGPHAVVPGPDGGSLYIAVGNQTPVTGVDHSRVPQVWDEDLLLERPYGRGFMKGVTAPGGWVARTDPEGETWELVATGFRNQYDIAFNLLGDLFTFDADMEWDLNLPWYRPTRINHILSGAEFGWRTQGGKWPEWYPDSVGAVVDIGPGSPTGVIFGYGAKFPAKYQNALYAADWSYGKLYAVHLEPEGSSYTASFEEFMSAQPLPLTAMVVNPEDGAMYVIIGGRRVQSGLYRVSYVGDGSVDPVEPGELGELHLLRRSLEEFHGEGADPQAALEAAWPHLGHEDRYLRYAARTAIEHQPAARWRERALAETRPDALIQAMIALARTGGPADQGPMLDALMGLDFDALSGRQRRDLARAYSLAFIRFGEGDDERRAALAEQIAEAMPFLDPELNAESLQLLVYLGDPRAVPIGIELLKRSPSQEEQLNYAKSLRHQTEGWDLESRREFFEWFARAAGYTGGAEFSHYIEDMKNTALENTPEDQQVALKEVIESAPPEVSSYVLEPRGFVKAWTMDDFRDLIHAGLEGGRDFGNGRRMYGVGACFVCHRFQQEGGAFGPDLTSAAGQFSPWDLLEAIIDPSKEISDQYGQMVFEMQDGSVVIGRIMNLSGDHVTVNTNMMDPNQTERVDRRRVVSTREHDVSMMPEGLINTMSDEDVLDLLAYILSMGDPEDPMFVE